MQDFLIYKGYVFDLTSFIFLVFIVFIAILVIIIQLSKIATAGLESGTRDLTILFVFAVTFFGSIFILNKVLKDKSTQYDIAYQNELYQHYDEYQDSIINIIYNPESKENDYELIIGADNDLFKLSLYDNVAGFEEKVDTEADGDYYELHKDEDNKKVVLVKYIKYTEEQKKASDSGIKKIRVNGVSQ